MFDILEYFVADTTGNFFWILLNSLVHVRVDHVARVVVRVFTGLFLRLVVVKRALLVGQTGLLCFRSNALSDVEPVRVILLARQVVEFVEFAEDEVFFRVFLAAGGSAQGRSCVLLRITIVWLIQVLNEQTLLALEYHVLYLLHHWPLLIHQPLYEDIQSIVLGELVLQIRESGIEDREPVVRCVGALLLHPLRMQLPLVQVELLDVIEVPLRHAV